MIETLTTLGLLVLAAAASAYAGYRYGYARASRDIAVALYEFDERRMRQNAEAMSEAAKSPYSVNNPDFDPDSIPVLCHPNTVQAAVDAERKG